MFCLCLIIINFTCTYMYVHKLIRLVTLPKIILPGIRLTQLSCLDGSVGRAPDWNSVWVLHPVQDSSA